MLKQLKITLNWWQAALYELTLLAFGLAVGSYWPEIFDNLQLPLLITAALAGGYILSLWLKQNRRLFNKTPTPDSDKEHPPQL